MLHEEVIVNWNELQEQIQDTKFLETLQVDFVPGVHTHTPKKVFY